MSRTKLNRSSGCPGVEVGLSRQNLSVQQKRLWPLSSGMQRGSYWLTSSTTKTTKSTAVYYESSLRKLSKKIAEKCPRKLHRRVLFHHGNAPAHGARQTRAVLREFRWEIIQHPLYSSDLAPSNFFIFKPENVIERILSALKCTTAVFAFIAIYTPSLKGPTQNRPQLHASKLRTNEKGAQQFSLRTTNKEQKCRGMIHDTERKTGSLHRSPEATSQQRK
ncbi:hypothetical protein FHG87_014004 [Trinorchestia longiramus]|nr:hypothetical protein FHG87_014004 [Trinorchestia longiramus]